MTQKKGWPGFTQSESELLQSALDRHDDWAVVVCLVVGGQEINTGEAGICAWIESVRTVFPGWDVYISPHLTESEYASTSALARLSESRAGAAAATFDPALHLYTSMRSFRAESLSRFVKTLLDGEATVRKLFASFRGQYPIVLTRSMPAGRRQTEEQRRGTERAGLVASSSAQRLKPHAIDIRVNIDQVHSFLSPAKATSSSLYHEDAATEFQVQGLELDWTIVTCDANLRWSGEAKMRSRLAFARSTSVKKKFSQNFIHNFGRIHFLRLGKSSHLFVVNVINL